MPSLSSSVGLAAECQPASASAHHDVLKQKAKRLKFLRSRIEAKIKTPLCCKRAIMRSRNGVSVIKTDPTYDLYITRKETRLLSRRNRAMHYLRNNQVENSIAPQVITNRLTESDFFIFVCHNFKLCIYKYACMH